MTADALAKLHRRAMTDTAAWSVAEFNALLSTAGHFLVTRPDAVPEPIGFALGRVTIDEAELLTLAVDPASWRQGIGRACLTAFEVAAAKQGAVTAFLEVAATNAPAIALYLSRGWQKIGLRKAYYQGVNGRIDAIVMRKALTPE